VEVSRGAHHAAPVMHTWYSKYAVRIADARKTEIQ